MPFPAFPSLCPTCQHCKSIRNKRGSVFLLCQWSKEDARFTKYPPQPVIRCAAYQEMEPPN